MSFKFLVPVAILAAGLSGFSADANAANGRKKSLLTGAAIGVAAGAAGAYLLTRNSGSSQQAAEPETTGSVRRATYAEECNARDVELFDRKGNYVKTERMRVCQ